MSVGSPVAGDIPGVYDIIINGKGYIFSNTIDPNLPFRTQRARYSYTPTFIERLNVQGNYGDNQQAFWQTASQNDWSLGEGQHFFRANDDNSRRRFWRGENIDASMEGQVRLFGAATSITFANPAVFAMSRNGGNAVAITTSNLYDVDAAGTITDLGAHGAGISVASKGNMAADGFNIFISGDSGQIRKYDGAAYTNFSATLAQSMCFLDNTLWGVQDSTLSYYSTAGVASTAFTWKTADGLSKLYGRGMQIKPYGGQVLVLRPGINSSPAELWTADTTGANQVAAFPTGFSPKAMAVVNGIAFIVGEQLKKNYGYRCEIWYYANGNIGRAYASECFQSVSNPAAICEYGKGFAFIDGPNKQVLAYDLTNGSVTTIANSFPNPTGTRWDLAPNNSGLLLTANVAPAYVLPTAAAQSTGKVISSQFDFDSSLVKLFRGVTVDWTAATDGDGGSVDIKYKVNATDIGPLDLTYTTLQTGAVTGTEYLLSSVTGTSISVQVTLNKGTSTNGPILKRVYVRAVPLQQTYRRDEVIIDCTGRDGKKPVQLRNGLDHPLDGLAQVNNLRAAITSTTPIPIIDRFGTVSAAVIEAAETEILEVRPEEFLVRLVFREI